MRKLKFILTKQKKYKFKKIYLLKLANKKKTTKFNHSINLGSYVSNIKLYLFKYPTIISSFKLGANFSKQPSLISLFYLKKIFKKNLQ